MLLDIMWDWEVSGGPMSCTWLSHLRGSGLTPRQSTKTLSATQLRRKVRKKERKIIIKNKIKNKIKLLKLKSLKIIKI